MARRRVPGPGARRDRPKTQVAGGERASRARPTVLRTASIFRAVPHPFGGARKMGTGTEGACRHQESGARPAVGDRPGDRGRAERASRGDDAADQNAAGASRAHGPLPAGPPVEARDVRGAPALRRPGLGAVPLVAVPPCRRVPPGQGAPPRGEREEPQEQFLRHAAAITGLYVALVRLAPSLGWELLAFQREVEAREEFTLRDRQAAIVPDAFVVIWEGEVEYHAMVEIDRGTMSIPRLSRKLSLYLGWVDSGTWSERHPYVPALLAAKTTARRGDQVVAKAEERARAESRTAETHRGAMAIQRMVIAACDCVDRPEAAVVDPVRRRRGGVGGLRLADLIREPRERWQRETAERAAAVKEAERELEEFLSSERLRDKLQDLNRNWYGVTSHDEHLRPLAENDATALHLLLNATNPMTPLERRAWGFFARRTEMSRFLGRPVQVRDQVPMSSEEREAVTSLREDWFARQKQFLASLHARYRYLPWA